MHSEKWAPHLCGVDLPLALRVEVKVVGEVEEVKDEGDELWCPVKGKDHVSLDEDNCSTTAMKAISKLPTPSSCPKDGTHASGMMEIEGVEPDETFSSFWVVLLKERFRAQPNDRGAGSEGLMTMVQEGALCPQ